MTSIHLVFLLWLWSSITLSKIKLNFIVMVLQGHTNMIENVDFYRKMAVY